MNAVSSLPVPKIDAALTLDGVHVRFGGVTALNDVSIAIPGTPGISAIIGPNGAGKTTLFNVLTGLVRPTEGRVLISGSDMTGRKADEIFRARISRTFQGVRLFAHLSVVENVALAARSALPRDDWRSWLGGASRARARARECLAMVGIDERLWEVWPDRLTLLQQRLVEIARALTASPSAMLLDEPAAGLNTAEKQRLCALFADIARIADCRVVVVEHDMKLVMSVAERIWVMNFGRLLAEGPPDVVRADPAVIEAYLGTGAQHAD